MYCTYIMPVSHLQKDEVILSETGSGMATPEGMTMGRGNGDGCASRMHTQRSLWGLL